MTTIISTPATTIRSQFDTLIADLTVARHPALAMARRARNIAQAAAEGKATEKHLDGLRTLRVELVTLHNRSHLNGFRLFCRRLANLIDRLGARMAQALKRTAPATSEPEEEEEAAVVMAAPQVNGPRDLLAEATAAKATAREVACALAE